MVFMVRLTRSTGFACAWHGGMVVCTTPRSSRNLSSTLFLNSVPFSEWKVSGRPNRKKTRLLSSFRIVYAFALSLGTHSIHQEKKSMNTSKYSWPRGDLGEGPIMSPATGDLPRAHGVPVAYEASWGRLLHLALLANRAVAHEVRSFLTHGRPIIV